MWQVAPSHRLRQRPRRPDRQHRPAVDAVEPVRDIGGLQKRQDHPLDVGVEVRQLARQLRLELPEDLGDRAVEPPPDHVLGLLLRRLEVAPLAVDRVAQPAQLALHLVERPRLLVDAAELGLEVGAQRAGQRLWRDRPRPVQHLVAGAQHRPEQIQLLAQDLEGQPLRLVVPRQEVDHRDVAVLPVAMTAPDALLDPLRVPRQVVVHHRVAELQVEPLGPGLRRDQHPRPVPELVDQRQPHRHVVARPALRRQLAPHLLEPAVDRLYRSRRVVGPPEQRHLVVADHPALDELPAQVVLRRQRLGEHHQLAAALAALRLLDHEPHRAHQRLRLAVAHQRAPARDERLDPRQLRRDPRHVR
jgi:hypothetical protein